MALDGHADVVVVGFGVAGAAAALAAAYADARVLVLDWSVPSERGFGASRAARSRAAVRTGLQAAARAAGVEVREQCRVHELQVDAGKVCGVGYATVPSNSTGATGHRWLRGMAGRAPAGLAPTFTRAAEAVWRSVFRVGETSCSSVVLALDPRHWEFVGPAMWSAVRGRPAVAASPTPTPTRRLRVIPWTGEVAVQTPELAVRTWCASRDSYDPLETSGAVARQGELCVDEATGSVLLSGDEPLPGLYSAVVPRHSHAADPGAALRAGRRAGQGAAGAVGNARAWLRSIG
jgi:hypothetical protein